MTARRARGPSRPVVPTLGSVLPAAAAVTGARRRLVAGLPRVMTGDVAHLLTCLEGTRVSTSERRLPQPSARVSIELLVCRFGLQELGLGSGQRHLIGRAVRERPLPPRQPPALSPRRPSRRALHLDAVQSVWFSVVACAFGVESDKSLSSIRLSLSFFSLSKSQTPPSKFLQFLSFSPEPAPPPLSWGRLGGL